MSKYVKKIFDLVRSVEEQHNMELTAISCGVLANTRESEKGRLSPDNPYWTPTLQDVYCGVDREIALRESRAEAVLLLGQLFAACKAEPAMQGRKYVDLGIGINNFMNRFSKH